MSELSLKVVITGASGLLGRAVLEYCINENLQLKYPSESASPGEASPNIKLNCLGLCNSRVRKNLRPLNLNNGDEVEKLIAEFKVSCAVDSAADP